MANEVVQLGELLDVLTDYHANGAYKKLKENVELLDEPNYAAIIRTTNFEQNNFDTSLKYINEHAYNFLKKSKVYAGDLIMNKIANAGSCYLMPELGMPVSLAMNLFLLRVTQEKANPSYVYLYLKLNESYVKSFANESVTKTITKEAVRNLEVVLPARKIQDDIVATYSAYTSKIELNRQTNQTLEQMAQALFKSWFVDFDPVIDKALEAGNPIPEPLQARAERRKSLGSQHKPLPEHIQSLFPNSFVCSEEMGWVPKGWNVLPILDVCDMLGGTQPPANTFIDEPKDGYVRLLQIRDFSNDNHVTFIPDSPKLRRASVDDILIGRYGSASGDRRKDSLGRICRGKSGAYNVALMKLSPIRAGREFCLRLFDSDLFYDYLYGISSKAVQSGFSKKELGLCKVCLPVQTLVDEYENFGEMIWLRSKAIGDENDCLAGLRDALLPKLISGELRLPSEALADAEQQPVNAIV